MNTLSRKEREFHRRGQDILDAALALFQSDNWEAVTVEQIALKAEVAKGTVYKHFASKDEIYAQLAIDFSKRILLAIDKVNTDLPVIQRFRQYMRCAWEIHFSSPELHRVFLYCSRTEFLAGISESTRTKILSIDEEISRPLQALIGEGAAQAIFPNSDAGFLLFAARAAFWGAVQMIWSGYFGKVDREAYLDSLTDFILAGMMYHDVPQLRRSPVLAEKS